MFEGNKVQDLIVVISLVLKFERSEHLQKSWMKSLKYWILFNKVVFHFGFNEVSL